MSNNNIKQFKNQGRQGDVYLRRLDSRPEKVGPALKMTKYGDNKLILAEGEVTGHHHRFENLGDAATLYAISQVLPNGTADVMVLEIDNRKFNELPLEVRSLWHEEHTPISPIVALDSDGKTYIEIRKQREYAYGTTRRVAD